jgi:hypothetical protein
MNFQTGDGFKRGTNVLREFLADGFKQFFKVIKIFELISRIFLQPGKNLLEVFSHFF